MCWKWILNLFGNNDDPQPDIPNEEFYSATHKALLFGINDYWGSSNDLNGCINDIQDREAKLLQFWPQFKIRKYLDKDATIPTFVREAEKAINSMKPGEVVIIPFDSCFSGTATRKSGQAYAKGRFMDPGIPRRATVRHIARAIPEDMRWLAYSACLENQTAADAFIGGRYNGAFTYYDVKETTPGITYAEHYNRIRKHLPSTLYSQVPLMEGPEWIKNEVMFEKPTLIIAFSGHGSYTYAADSQEADGQDEAIVLYDGLLVDNKINQILQQIPVLTT